MIAWRSVPSWDESQLSITDASGRRCIPMELTGKGLKGLDLDSLEIADFVDETTAADSELIAKVMSASCTTCECCCSCSSL